MFSGFKYSNILEYYVVKRPLSNFYRENVCKRNCQKFQSLFYLSYVFIVNQLCYNSLVVKNNSFKYLLISTSIIMFSQKIFADCAVGYCGVNRRSTIIQWSMLSSSVVQIIGLIIIVVIILLSQKWG